MVMVVLTAILSPYGFLDTERNDNSRNTGHVSRNDADDRKHVNAPGWKGVHWGIYLNATNLYNTIILPVVLLKCLVPLLQPFEVNQQELIGWCLVTWGLVTFSVNTTFGGTDELTSLKRLGIVFTLGGIAMTLFSGAAISGGGGWGVVLSISMLFLSSVENSPFYFYSPTSDRRSTSFTVVDNKTVVRIAIFGILFGSGLAYFACMQFISGSSSDMLGVAIASTTSVSSVGCIIIVLARHLDISNMDEVKSVAQIWLFGIIPLFGIVQFLFEAFVLKRSAAVLTMTEDDGHHWFGVYVTISAVFIYAVAVALRCRDDRNVVSKRMASIKKNG